MPPTLIDPTPGGADMPFALSPAARGKMMQVSEIEMNWLLIGLMAKSNSASLPSTPQYHRLGASGSVTIPAGAKSWSWVITDGTGTVGGVAVKAGTADTSESPLAAGLTITTDAASDGLVRWAT